MLNIDQSIAVICKEFSDFCFKGYEKDQHDSSRCIIRGTYLQRDVNMEFPIARLRNVDQALLALIRERLGQIGKTGL